jgi:hypothetical protein
LSELTNANERTRAILHELTKRNERATRRKLTIPRERAKLVVMTNLKERKSMVFYTIVSREFGRFCGYQRKAKDLWLKRPVFRWDTFPHHGEAMVFHHERSAKDYLAAHPDLPSDCEVKFSDLGEDAPYGHPVVSP